MHHYTATREDANLLCTLAKSNALFLLHCRIMVVFVDKEGVENVLEAPIGKSLLEVAHDNEIELEGELTIPHVALLLC